MHITETARLKNLEDLLIGTVDNGKSREGLVAKVTRIDWMLRIGFVVIIARDLGVPTEQVVKLLATVLGVFS